MQQPTPEPSAVEAQIQEHPQAEAASANDQGGAAFAASVSGGEASAVGNQDGQATDANGPPSAAASQAGGDAAASQQGDLPPVESTPMQPQELQPEEPQPEEPQPDEPRTPPQQAPGTPQRQRSAGSDAGVAGTSTNGPAEQQRQQSPRGPAEAPAEEPTDRTLNRVTFARSSSPNSEQSGRSRRSNDHRLPTHDENRETEGQQPTVSLQKQKSHYLFHGLCRKSESHKESLWVDEEEDREDVAVNLEVHGHSFHRKVSQHSSGEQSRGSWERRPSNQSGGHADASGIQSGPSSKSHGKPVRAESSKSHGHGHGGGHGESSPNLVSATASGLINFLLMFGLCCAYALITFNDEWNGEHRGIGVKMHVGSAMIAGTSLAYFSGIPVAIGGPDLNPVVFIGLFTSTIAKEVASDVGLEYPEVESKRRRLAGGDSSDEDFCKDYKKYLNTNSEEDATSFGEGLLAGTSNSTTGMDRDTALACQDYHERFRATSLFAVGFSSLVHAFVFLGLGRFKLAAYVSYIPSSVMEAFLACVGWKVFSYAIKFCEYEPWQFIPASIIGVAMFFVKAAHIGNPAVVIPLILLVPLGCFHIYAAIDGGVAKARDDGLMFPEIENEMFWTVWVDGILKIGKVSFKAWAKTLPDLVTMIIVVVLDCLLKVSATESKLPVKYNTDQELVIDGLHNFATAASFTSVGYMQLKFNVINYGIIRNVHDRRAGLIFAMLMGVAFLVWHGFINYMPRFFLSALLFFAGAGFVADNLWGSRYHLSFIEWFHILIIVGVFVFSGQLIYAVLVGFVIICCDFLIRFGQVATAKGGIVAGGQFSTIQRYDPLVHYHLEHVLDSWLMVVHLKGFIFFASAQKLKQMVHDRLLTQFDLPPYKRARFLVFDCALLDGLDASAAKAIRTIGKEASRVGVKIIWCSIGDGLRKNLLERSVVSEDGLWYPALSGALQFVEQCALERLTLVQQRWLGIHPTFEQYHHQLAQQRQFEPFDGIFTRHITAATARADPWIYCKRKGFTKGDAIFAPFAENVGLYIVHHGTVGMFDEIPTPEQLKHPQIIYRHGWFLNIQALTKGKPQKCAACLEDVEVIVFYSKDLVKMMREQPVMFSNITKGVMKQQIFEEQLMSKDHSGAVLSQPKASEHKFLPSMDRQRPWERMAQDWHLPYMLNQQVRGVHTAESLARFGVYNEVCSDASVVLPRMPPRLEQHFSRGFNNVVKIISGPDAAPILQPHQLKYALFYGGVFDAKVPHVPNQQIKEDDFMEIVQRLLFAPLTAKQKDAAKAMFKRFDKDKSGALDRDQVDDLFNEMAPSIGMEVVDGLFLAYGHGNEAGVQLEDFFTMVSRFAKAHELDWELLQALQSLGDTADMRVFGDEPWTGWTGQATPEMIMGRSKAALQQYEAEEMLWVMDWHSNGAGEGKTLGLDGVIGSVLMALPESTSFSKTQSGYSVEEQAQVFQPQTGPSGMSSRRLPGQQDGCLSQMDIFLNHPGTYTAADLYQIVLIAAWLLLLIVEPIAKKEAKKTFTKDSAEDVWTFLEVGFIVVFTAELIVRLIVDRCRAGASKFYRELFLNALFWADLMAIVPSYVDWLVQWDWFTSQFGISVDGGTYWHFAFGLLKVARLLWVLRSSRFGKGLQKSNIFYPSAAVIILCWGIFLSKPSDK